MGFLASSVMQTLSSLSTLFVFLLGLVILAALVIFVLDRRQSQRCDPAQLSGDRSPAPHLHGAR